MADLSVKTEIVTALSEDGGGKKHAPPTRLATIDVRKPGYD